MERLLAIQQRGVWRLHDCFVVQAQARGKATQSQRPRADDAAADGFGDEGAEDGGRAPPLGGADGEDGDGDALMGGLEDEEEEGGARGVGRAAGAKGGKGRAASGKGASTSQPAARSVCDLRDGAVHRRGKAARISCEDD